MTHTATAHAVEYTGARLFEIISDLSGNIRLDKIKKINKRTKGVILGTCGRIPEVDKIAKYCKRKKY